MTHFATVSSVQADLKDLALVEKAYRRLHLRTGDEWFSEQASVVREIRDREAAALRERASWVQRVLGSNREIGTYR